MGGVLPASPRTDHRLSIWLVRALGALALVSAADWPVDTRADTAMSVPVISQQSGAWAALPLGRSPVDTIGSAGCAVSAVAMVLNYYGVPSDPAQLNAWLTANNGYAAPDDVIWGAVGDASGGQVDFTGWYGADVGRITSELSAGRPVIAEVSLNGNQHFVVLAGMAASGGFIANDPWYSDQLNFASRYGDPSTGILSIRTFALRAQSGPRGAGGDLLPVDSLPISSLATPLRQGQ
jgi:hypothetical protein